MPRAICRMSRAISVTVVAGQRLSGHADTPGLRVLGGLADPVAVPAFFHGSIVQVSEISGTHTRTNSLNILRHGAEPTDS